MNGLVSTDFFKLVGGFPNQTQGAKDVARLRNGVERMPLVFVRQVGRWRKLKVNDAPVYGRSLPWQAAGMGEQGAHGEDVTHYCM